MSVTIGKDTKSKVQIVNGAPYISTNINLNAKLLSLNKHTNSFEENDIKLIETYANSYIRENIEKYLYKTSKDYKADIAMFGRYAVSNFSTWDKWTKYNWLDNYENSFFDVNVKVDVISSYLVS